MSEGIIEDALSNFSNKRAEIQGTKANVQTRPEVTREDPDAKRSPTNRLIRGSLVHALEFLRDDSRVTGDNREVLYKFAEKERAMHVDLDKLDAQYRNNTVEVADGHGGKIHAITLDLSEPEEGAEDTRVPWVMVGGATSTDEGNAGLPIAMALGGQRITVLTYPEQMRLQNGGDGRSVLESLSNKSAEDLEIFKTAIEGLGSKKVNLLGHSLGGAMVLAMASDPDFTSKVEINDVVAMAPTGFEERSVTGVTLGFAKEGGRLNKDPEAKVFLDQGVVDANRPSGVGGDGIKGVAKMGLDLLTGARGAATQMVDGEKLAQAATNIKGDLEIWTSSDDKIIKGDTIAKTIQFAPLQSNNVFYNILEGGNHNSYFTEAFGFNRARQQEQEARQAIGGGPFIGKKMSVDSMERTGAEFLLKGMI